MTDLSQTIAPKSDQLNADDLIGQSRTIRVSRVSRMSEPDQPIAISFEGDNGKPYKPCKSMRRVLVKVWGNDGNAYVGRRMTLYRDDTVQFGGNAVGGIRISHMSGITQSVTMALTASRTVRKPYTIKPLSEEQASEAPRQRSGRERLYDAARTAAADGSQALTDFRKGLTDQQDDALAPILDELKRTAAHADEDFPGNDTIRGEAA